jgi:uncharacterized membrane protein HdeD (DUF308 family)
VVLILARNWWALVLRGLLGLGIGIFTFARPAAVLGALVLLFGLYALFDGLLGVIAAVRGSHRDRSWWALLLGGLSGVLAGGLALIAPQWTALVLLYVIALRALLSGGLEITAAFRLREQIANEWRLALSGALSVLFAIAVLVAPAAGALAVVLLIGAYALASGAVLIALGLRLRAAARPTAPTLRRAA